MTDYGNMIPAWEEWINQTPGAVYASWVGQQRGSPAMRRYYEGQYSPMYSRYLGDMGTQALGGQMPSQKFTDWLSGYPAKQQYQNLPDYMTGRNYWQFSPSYRWLPY